MFLMSLNYRDCTHSIYLANRDITVKSVATVTLLCYTFNK